MEAAGRRVLASFYGISKMGFSQHFVPVSWPGRRSIRSFSSSTLHKPTDPRGGGEGSLEFLEWHNGGGHFHRTACVDPTVFIGVGAIVHQNSVLGADVHIGSGSIVGPSVSIGQSTKTEHLEYNHIHGELHATPATAATIVMNNVTCGLDSTKRH